MKKEDIRREYFKLRIKGHTNNQCRKILLAQFSYEVTIRTLRRWTNKLNKTEWDLKDKSKRPKTIHTKLTPEIEEKVIKISDTNFKVQVKEAPEKGRANQAVLKALADYFGTSQSNIKIISGSTSKLKIIEIAK